MGQAGQAGRAGRGWACRGLRGAGTPSGAGAAQPGPSQRRCRALAEPRRAGGCPAAPADAAPWGHCHPASPWGPREWSPSGTAGVCKHAAVGAKASQAMGTGPRGTGPRGTGLCGTGPRGTAQLQTCVSTLARGSRAASSEQRRNKQPNEFPGSPSALQFGKGAARHRSRDVPRPVCAVGAAGAASVRRPEGCRGAGARRHPGTCRCCFARHGAGEAASAGEPSSGAGEPSSSCRGQAVSSACRRVLRVQGLRSVRELAEGQGEGTAGAGGSGGSTCRAGGCQSSSSRAGRRGAAVPAARDTSGAGRSLPAQAAGVRGAGC